MPRLPRVYIESILYYVTAKAGYSQGIFTKPSDYQEYITLIDKYKKQYGFKLFSYVLLPTHIHMLIELKNDIGISNIMHDINSLYTKIFNSQYNRKGHLFQERFKAVFAEKETYLLQLTRHIQLNPKRMGLVSQPEDYPYSSYPQFIDPAKRIYPDLRGETEEIFSILKGREDAFRDYVKNAEPKETEEVKKKLRKGRILGTKVFADRINKAIEEAGKRQKASPLRKIVMTYLLLGGVLIFITAVTFAYFSKKSATLKTEYDNTILLYKKTLEALEREKKDALDAKKDVEQYAWKIRLAEKALEEMKEERAVAIKTQKEIEGYAWIIELRQIGGPSADFAAVDTIFFENNQLHSVNLDKEDFSASNYSKRDLRNGNIVWETIQTNKQGDAASWRGEWNGEIMKGILSMRSTNGIMKDFSFTATGEKMRR